MSAFLRIIGSFARFIAERVNATGEPVLTVDIVPTLAQLAGLEPEDGDGRDLLTTELDANRIHYDEIRVIGSFSYHPGFHRRAALGSACCNWISSIVLRV